MIAQRVSLITLGVGDLARARRFYGAWGWAEAGESVDGQIAFYQLAGQVLGLYPRNRLARDQGRGHLPSGSGAVTLSINFADRAGVDAAHAEATAAGAQAMVRPAATDWGGYVGYVADPEGHVWEFAHNPDWPIAADGSLTLPSAAKPSAEGEVPHSPPPGASP